MTFPYAGVPQNGVVDRTLKITVASVCAAAVVWSVGLPAMAMSFSTPGLQAPFLSSGIVAVLMGLALAPAADANPAIRLRGLTRPLGSLACLALILLGILFFVGLARPDALLVRGALVWPVDVASLLAVGALACWILLLTPRGSAPRDRLVRWFGTLTVSSFVLALISSITPLSWDTSAGGVALGLASALLVWACLPGWLISFALRLRALGSARTPEHLAP